MATRCYEEISCVEDGGRGIDTMVEHEISGQAEAQVCEKAPFRLCVSVGAGQVTGAACSLAPGRHALFGS
jgi:hypothetical protein